MRKFWDIFINILTGLLVLVIVVSLVFGITAGICQHKDITIITANDEILTFHITNEYCRFEDNYFQIGNERYCNIKYYNVDYCDWCKCKKINN